MSVQRKMTFKKDLIKCVNILLFLTETPILGQVDTDAGKYGKITNMVLLFPIHHNHMITSSQGHETLT